MTRSVGLKFVLQISALIHELGDTIEMLDAQNLKRLSALAFAPQLGLQIKFGPRRRAL
ncbi:hypothetical protein HMPREF0185_02786 [Brevundimonas diminuta 470-4]|nr:hypothetical protein HMPREF0185_02786 [Brevundimonas diminuta 470-4]